MSGSLALPLLGFRCRCVFGGSDKPCSSALGTGDEPFALAPGTHLARTHNNPGFIAGIARAFAGGARHLSLSGAPWTLNFVFGHRHPPSSACSLHQPGLKTLDLILQKTDYT